MVGFQRDVSWLSALIFGLLALLIAEGAAAQATYPEKPVRLIDPYPAGSQSDTVARFFGQKLAETLGKPVLIDNVSGAGGNIGADRIAKAAPDGYTLGLLSQAQLVINPILYKLAYDPVKDFAPVSQIAISLNILVVHHAVPATSVNELVALAKAQPGVLTFASGGSGTGSHLAGELLKSVAGLDIRHIPYKGGGGAVPDLLGGRVTMMFSPIVVGLPLARSGKLRALAIASLKRAAAVPELPTVAESGYPGFEVTVWHGLLGPTDTPAMIVRKLHLDTVKALAHPDLRAKFSDLGLDGIGNSPAELTAIIKSEIAKWTKVIKDAGIKSD